MTQWYSINCCRGVRIEQSQDTSLANNHETHLLPPLPPSLSVWPVYPLLGGRVSAGCRGDHHERGPAQRPGRPQRVPGAVPHPGGLRVLELRRAQPDLHPPHLLLPPLLRLHHRGSGELRHLHLPGQRHVRGPGVGELHAAGDRGVGGGQCEGRSPVPGLPRDPGPRVGGHGVLLQPHRAGLPPAGRRNQDLYRHVRTKSAISGQLSWEGMKSLCHFILIYIYRARDICELRHVLPKYSQLIYRSIYLFLFCIVLFYVNYKTSPCITL